MSILAHLNKLESSTIYKLKFNGNIVGFRVKYYSLEASKFLYCDFETSYVQRQDLRDFLNKHKRDFECLTLVQHGDLVCTQEELDGSIKVEEFKSDSYVNSILSLVIPIIEGRG